MSLGRRPGSDKLIDANQAVLYDQCSYDDHHMNYNNPKDLSIPSQQEIQT